MRCSRMMSRMKSVVAKRIAAMLIGAYLAAALAGRLRERLGLIACGCAQDCWCQQPGLSLFRWVFPRGHKSSWAGGPKPTV